MTHTSTEQPEALRQAAWLRKWFGKDTERAAQELEALHARVQELEAAQAQRAPLTDDAKRLDWLDKQVKGHSHHTGYAWQETGCESDRGLVCKIQSGKNKMTARQAIDAARNITQEKQV